MPMGVALEIDVLVLQGAPQPLDEYVLSIQRPRPSIEILIPAVSSVLVKSEPKLAALDALLFVKRQFAWR